MSTHQGTETLYKLHYAGRVVTVSAMSLQHAYESIGLNPAMARKPVEVRRLDGRAMTNAAQHRATYSPTLCN